MSDKLLMAEKAGLRSDVPPFAPGDTVKVQKGYARNFLLPRSLALEATSAGARVFQEHERVTNIRRNRARIAAERFLRTRVRPGDRVALMHAGRVLAQDTPAEFEAEA